MKKWDPTAVEKQVVLVGAGNAHLVFLKKWRMNPVPGVSVILVNESAEMPYSAMIPGFLAREYWPTQMAVDLVPFCNAAGVRLIAEERVAAIDLKNREVTLAKRLIPLPFHFLSLNVGNVAAPGQVTAQNVFSLRPLSTFLSRLPELDNLTRHGKKVVVVGAGPSGCEVAIALANRYRDTAVKISVYEAAERATPNFPLKASVWFQKLFRKNQISFLPKQTLQPENFLDFDAVILATSPQPESWFKVSGLDCDAHGFIKVAPTLQSVSHEFVFAAGDVAAVQGVRPFAKNGVYSVRMGGTLYRSVSAALLSKPFPKFTPQKNYLALLNGGEGRGLLTYGGLALSGRWTRRLKHRIDEAWMKSFAVAVPNSDEEPEKMPCRGCGAKVPGLTLKASLNSLSLTDREDSSIEAQPNGEKVTLRSVDFLSSFLDDPYTFGKITALHCVSDLYAMNGKPLTALAILSVPWSGEVIQKQWILEVMTGANEIAAQEGFKINGGHTGEADTLSFGLSVSGEAVKAKLFLKGQLKRGDILVLTKRLGIGTLLAAAMRSLATSREMKEGIQEMLKSNRLAREIFNEVGVMAATDVTGFGLAGHLGEMIEMSSAQVKLAPHLEVELSSFKRLNALGIQSTAYPENKKYQTLAGGGALPDSFFDPQTSGGLLGAISAAQWNAFEKMASDRGLYYCVVGTVERP